jgi:chromosome segregation ATPase
MYNSQNNNQNPRTLLTILILLLIFSIGSSIYFWNKSRNAGASVTSLTESVQALEAEKARIEHALDSLSAAYGEVRIENEGLRGKEASTAELIAQKDASIKKIKSQNNRELAALRAQLDELRQLKIEYETLITAVQVENEQLKAENQRLLGENKQLQTENSSLNGQVGDLAQKLEDQIRKTQSAKFKATSFKVEIGRKNDKQTIRAKKAREINVSFDLIDVPEKYHGDQHLYLVITDEKGKAISSTKPIKTTIEAPTGNLQIEAQQVKAVSLAEKQRLSFNYKLDERLKSGNYVAAIYCNVGLLGASTFRLN